MSLVDSPFEGLRAWVTGGRRGLGRAYAEGLADLGCEVHLTSRDPESPHALAALASLHARAEAYAARRGVELRAPRVHAWDMADASSTEALERAMKAHPPAILVHAAHVFGAHLPIVAQKPGPFTASLATNVGGAYAVSRAAGRHMARAKLGRILLVGSLASAVGGVGQVTYLTEKTALEGMMRAFATELGPRGVLVNIVQPGIVDTENVRDRVSELAQAGFAARTVAGRLLTAEEVVVASLSLLDPRQSALTGQVLRLSGGADLALPPRAADPEPRA